MITLQIYDNPPLPLNRDDTYRQGDSFLTPTSRAFCCPKCGQIWARMRNSRASTWTFYGRLCPVCPPTGTVMDYTRGQLTDGNPDSPLYLAPGIPEAILRNDLLSLIDLTLRQESHHGQAFSPQS